MPLGTIDKHGNITITGNRFTGDAIVVQNGDKLEQLLPCDECGSIQQVGMEIAVMLCDPCWKKQMLED